MDKDLFDDIYGDLPGGAYLAAAEEMNVDLLEGENPQRFERGYRRKKESRKRRERGVAEIKAIEKTGELQK